MKKILFLLAMFLCVNVFAQAPVVSQTSLLKKTELERQIFEDALARNEAFNAISARIDSVSSAISCKKADLRQQQQEKVIALKAKNEKTGTIIDTVINWGIVLTVVLFFVILILREKMSKRGYYLLVTTIVLFCVAVVIADWGYLTTKDKKLNTELALLNDSNQLYDDDQLHEMLEQQKLLLARKDELRSQVRLGIKPDIEKAWIREDSLAQVAKRSLERYIRANSFSKKLRIIACSWEGTADVPEYGYINGTLSSNGSLSALKLGGIGGGIGSSSTNGTLKGEYKGRKDGDPHRFFHFVLADNSYHVIDVSKNKMWLMAKTGMLVHYERKYSDYGKYTEAFTPLYSES